MDEYKLMNQVKEELCYISDNVPAELKFQKSHGTVERQQFKKFFVLPDFQSIHRGYVKEDGHLRADEQVLVMETERFSVPEVLFSPQDVEMNQKGIVEAVYDCIERLDEREAAIVSDRLLLTGGNVQFPNFLERFRGDLKPGLPDYTNPQVYIAEDPVHDAWLGRL